MIKLLSLCLLTATLVAPAGAQPIYPQMSPVERERWEYRERQDRITPRISEQERERREYRERQHDLRKPKDR